MLFVDGAKLSPRLTPKHPFVYRLALKEFYSNLDVVCDPA